MILGEFVISVLVGDVIISELVIGDVIVFGVEVAIFITAEDVDILACTRNTPVVILAKFVKLVVVFNIWIVVCFVDELTVSTINRSLIFVNIN